MGSPGDRCHTTGCIRCGSCCEAFLMDDELLDSHREFFRRSVREEKHFPQIRQTLVLTGDGRCVFLLPDNTCSIYEDRPEFPCRIFGIPGWLECPTVTTEGRLRTPDERERILERNADRSRWSEEFRQYFMDLAKNHLDHILPGKEPVEE